MTRALDAIVWAFLVGAVTGALVIRLVRWLY